MALEPFDHIEGIKDDAEKKAAQVGARRHGDPGSRKSAHSWRLLERFRYVRGVRGLTWGTAAGDQGGLPAQHRGLPREGWRLEPGKSLHTPPFLLSSTSQHNPLTPLHSFTSQLPSPPPVHPGRARGSAAHLPSRR